MFKELGAMMSLMKNAGEMKEKMLQLKTKLNSTRASASAGEGKVIVIVNGENRLVGCQIADDLLQQSSKEDLENYILEATNKALEQVQTAAADEMLKITGGINLPPGLSNLLG
jgi:DNA-binding YbaB/EbfC family protein